MRILRKSSTEPLEVQCVMSSARAVSEVERRHLQQGIAALGPWFHNFEIAKGVWTNPDGAGPGAGYPARRWAHVSSWFSELPGKSCLDVGSSSGFFSLKAAELGASSVLGIDSGEQVRAIEQASFARTALRLNSEFQSLSVYDLPQLTRTFDVVCFMGVFYHLRHPLLALEEIRKVCRGTLIFQTITTPSQKRLREVPGVSRDVPLNSTPMLDSCFPTLRFVEGGLEGDVTCWFVPNVEGITAILRSCGFTPKDFIFPDEREVFIRCTVS